MALAEKHRSVIYAHFVAQIGEEAAEAMLSQFPSRDLDEPVTKEFVAMTAAELRSEIAGVRTDLQAEIAGVRTEVAELRGEMRTEFAEVRGEMAQLGDHLAKRVQLTIGVATGILGALAIFVR